MYDRYLGFARKKAERLKVVDIETNEKTGENKSPTQALTFLQKETQQQENNW